MALTPGDSRPCLEICLVVILGAQTGQIRILQSENEDFRVWGLSGQGHTDKDTLFIFSADHLKKDFPIPHTKCDFRYTCQDSHESHHDLNHSPVCLSGLLLLF